MNGKAGNILRLLAVLAFAGALVVDQGGDSIWWRLLLVCLLLLNTHTLITKWSPEREGG